MIIIITNKKNNTSILIQKATKWLPFEAARGANAKAEPQTKKELVYFKLGLSVP